MFEPGKATPLTVAVNLALLPIVVELTLITISGSTLLTVNVALAVAG